MIKLNQEQFIYDGLIPKIIFVSVGLKAIK